MSLTPILRRYSNALCRSNPFPLTPLDHMRYDCLLLGLLYLTRVDLMIITY